MENWLGMSRPRIMKAGLEVDSTEHNARGNGGFCASNGATEVQHINSASEKISDLTSTVGTALALFRRNIWWSMPQSWQNWYLIQLKQAGRGGGFAWFALFSPWSKWCMATAQQHVVCYYVIEQWRILSTAFLKNLFIQGYTVDSSISKQGRDRQQCSNIRQLYCFAWFHQSGNVIINTRVGTCITHVISQCRYKKFVCKRR